MRIKAYTALLLSGLTSLWSGCASPERAAPRPETELRAEERSQQYRVRIPPSPVDFVGDYAEPYLGIRQLFRWAPHENEWRLTLVDPNSLHAGFLLHRPLAFPRQRTGMALYFEMHPPEIACSLALGLRDNHDTPAQSLPVVPIAQYRLFQRVQEDRGVFAIPLSRMETAAYALDSDGNWTPFTARLSWRNIIGVQLVILDPEALTTRQITIKNLQIVPKTAILPLRD